MNEEILKNAMFYLQQHAERMSDNIKSAKLNITFNKKVLNNATKRVMEDWGYIYKEKIRVSEERIKNWKNDLKQIDECVNEIGKFIKII